MTSTWAQRLVALCHPSGAFVVVPVFTPYGNRGAELCMMALVAACAREEYPRDALVG